MRTHETFMLEAINMAAEGMHNNEGGPFGAVIVREGEIVGKGNNKVLKTLDPTAHAEIVAIRDACSRLGTFQLDECILYTSCEPCPMCLGAIYWARPREFYFACGHSDAARFGFDDQLIYDEIPRQPGERIIVGTPLLREAGLAVFRQWELKEDKTLY